MAKNDDLQFEVSSKPGTHDELVLGMAVNGTSVIAVGGQGRDLFLLSDDGLTFREGRSPGRGLRNAWWNDQGIWVVGEWGYAARSTDGGGTWETIKTGTKGCLFGMVQDNDGTYWISGDDGYLARSEDGTSFKKVKGVESSISRLTVTSKGVLVPCDTPGQLFIAKGKSVEPTKAKAGTSLMVATMTPKGTIIAVGDNGLILRNEEGAKSFEKVASSAKGLLTAVDVLSDGRVIVVGDNALVLVSNDDGASFQKLAQHHSNEMFWCVKRHPFGALIGGTDGTILRVTSPALADTTATPVAIEAAAPPAPIVKAPPAKAEWRAPKPSTSRQPWTPPAPLPIETINGVFWTPRLRSLLHPRRGGIDTQVRPLPTIDDAWSYLRRALWAADAAGMQDKPSTSSRDDEERRSGIWERVTSYEPLSRRMGERILDPSPRKGNEADDVALVTMSFERYRTFIRGFWDDVYDALADFLAASLGLPEALRRAFKGMDDELPYTGVGLFGRFRDLLAITDDATYADARRAILDAVEAESKGASSRRMKDLHWAGTFLLPLGPHAQSEERELHEKCLPFVVPFGDFGVHACGLAAGDRATLEHFLKINKKVRHEFFSGEPRRYLTSLLELEGKNAAPVLAKMKLAEPFEDSAAENDKWCELLAHIDDDVALEALHKERKGIGPTWATGALITASRLGFDRVMDLAVRKKDKELVAILEREKGKPLDPIVRHLEDPNMQALSTPFQYDPPPAIHPVFLDNPIGLAPETRWREPIETDDAPDVEWNGAPLRGAKPEAIDAFVAHCEKWGIPTSIDAIGATPARVHPRLYALGFEFDTEYWMYRLLPALAYKHGTSALPLLVAALQSPRWETALPSANGIGDVSIAPTMVTAFAGKKNKAEARAWIVRHPKHAAAGTLVLFAKNPADENAQRVLRFLDAKGHRATLSAYAERMNVHSAVAGMLDRDPITKPPVLPKYANPAKLPKLAKENGGKASPKEVEQLLLQLAFSNADEIHPGVLAAKRSYTAESRAAFAWALFEAWLKAKADPKQGWCMQAIGFFGDDESARKLAAIAKNWPGEGKSVRAQAALDALLNIGTDAALVNINILAEKSRFAAFKEAAKERIEAIADARGLTADELADRLVPTLGLEEKGAEVLDFGKRKFTISFDEALVPIVKDADGKVLADLPKPAKGDDAQKAAAAKVKFSGLKKDARTSASLQIKRLERAMRSSRRIERDLFLECFATHPWMRHLARRLVWGVDGGDTFHVAEDGTLADIEDRTFTLPKDAKVGVMHPIDMSAATIAKWGERFAEYQIIQPFPQLSRPIHRPDDKEKKASVIDRFRGRKIEARTLRGLESRGWQRWMDDSVVFAKPLDKGHAILSTDPGWHPSQAADEVEEQTIEGIQLHGPQNLGELAPMDFSEIVYDVETILG